MQESCQCQNCRSKGSLSSSKKGCLRYSAVLKLCILVSHAVADALGAEDASGAPDPEHTMLGVITLLSEVIDQEIVRWDTWFAVATHAITGCSWDSFTDLGGDPEDEGGTSGAGVQYGSLAVLAPWLDFRAPLEIRGSFRINVYEGNIQGIKDDLALIRTEQASRNHSEKLEWMDVVEYQVEKLANTDDTPFEVQKALFRAENSMHRLLVIVKVNNHLRLVDPTRSMMNLSRSQHAACEHRRPSHNPKDLEQLLGSDLDIKACTFGDIFIQWVGDPNSNMLGSRSLDVSIVLDDSRKVHIALAISAGGVVLRDFRRCCLPCALKSCLRSGTPHEGLRSVINFQGPSQRQIGGLATTSVTTP